MMNQETSIRATTAAGKPDGDSQKGRAPILCINPGQIYDLSRNKLQRSPTQDKRTEVKSELSATSGHTALQYEFSQG